jgi:hypothetical protein
MRTAITRLRRMKEDAQRKKEKSIDATNSFPHVVGHAPYSSGYSQNTMLCSSSNSPAL